MKIKTLFFSIVLFISLFGEENSQNKIEDNSTVKDNIIVEKKDPLKEIEKLQKLVDENENDFFRIYKNAREFKSLTKQKENLEILLSVKKFKNLKEKEKLISELDDVETKLDFYEFADKDVIKLIRTDNYDISVIEFNFFDFISDKHFLQLNNFKSKFEKIEKNYHDLSYFLQDILNETKKINGNKKEQEKVIEFQNKIIEYYSYFKKIKILIKEQKNNLEKYELLLKEKEDQYVKVELKKQIVNIVIIFLMIIAYRVSKTINYNKNKDNEDKYNRYNKIIIISSLFSIPLFLIYVYIDNVKYAFTVIGFVGAALTIVNKEIIQSVIGWFYILFSGFIKQGDKIKIKKDGVSIVGEIMEISLTKMIIYEVTNKQNLNNFETLGRIISVPNNIVFTHTVFNYNHYSMKTIYDGIEIEFEFDNDFKVIEETTKEVILKHTDKYISMGQKQYAEIQKKYFARNKSFDPKIRFNINEDKTGIVMYIFFVSSYRDHLDMRSTITLSLLKKYKKNETIKLLNKNSKELKQNNQE